MSASVDKLNNTKFNLDASGVAGFFGGEEAVSAMGTVHLYRGQKWLGWYNSPGSYTVAKQYGKLANNRFWDALFPGQNVEPAVFFGLDGQSGPEFIAGRSGTRLKKTGHLAHIFVNAAQEYSPTRVPPNDPNDTRKRLSMVTVADLKGVEGISPDKLRKTSFLAASMTMIMSIAPCIACGVVGDWYCFGMILLGIVSNGLSCFVIGSGDLEFQKPQPSLGAPPADGILIDNSEVVILRGDECTVGSVISGKFILKYSGSPECRAIGICSLIQYAQFLAQLLLIPQGTLFGQFMFLATFMASWVYNCYLSSLDKEQLQADLLNKALHNPPIRRFELRTRTTMVVFALLTLNPTNPEALLHRLLPNDTKTWNVWKRNVLGQIGAKEPFRFNSTTNDEDVDDWKLLKDLYHDAETAYRAHNEHIVLGKHTSWPEKDSSLEV
jgi:hypothetical protein